MSFALAVALVPIQLTALTDISIATLTAVDGTNGNKFVANKNTILRVKNSGGGSCVVTLHANYTRDGLILPNKTYTVPATTGDEVIAGFTETFWQNEAREAWVEFSTTAGIQAQVLQP